MDDPKNASEDQLYEYLPLSIGIETVGGIFTPLVLRGTPLPATRSQTFTTAHDDQSEVTTKILIGERPIATYNELLGECKVSEIPPSKKGVPQLALTISVDNKLNVSAELVENLSNIKGSIVTDKKNFKSDDIAKMLSDAELYKSRDEEELKSKELDNKVKSVISRAESLLNSEKNTGSNFKSLEQALARLGIVVQSNDYDEIRTCTDELDRMLGSASIFGVSDLFDNLFKTNTTFVEKTKKSSVKPKVRIQKNDEPNDILADNPVAEPIKHYIGRIFGGDDYTQDPNLCFVLMPFNEEIDQVYEDHIKPVVESSGIICQRADNVYSTGLITSDIWEKIVRARFIIADLTGKNPNVFYEVGLAHALGKEVVLLTQSMDHVPFDLKALRCIVYAFTPRGSKELESKLKSTVTGIMSSA